MEFVIFPHLTRMVLIVLYHLVQDYILVTDDELEEEEEARTRTSVLISKEIKDNKFKLKMNYVI